MVLTAASPHRLSLLGVLYAEDFDEDGLQPGVFDPQPGPEPEIIEPRFSAAELEAARAEARQVGRGEAEDGLAASRIQLVAKLVDGLGEARAGAFAAAEQAAEGVARCMLSALAACLPALCEQHSAGELRMLVRTLLPALSEEPRIIVRVHSDTMAAMQEEMSSLDAEIGERVHLLATDAIAPGDARISWAEGSATRDASRSRAAFEQGLALLGLLQREHADA